MEEHKTSLFARYMFDYVRRALPPGMVVSTVTRGGDHLIAGEGIGWDSVSGRRR